MAEGLFNALAPAGWAARSAGTDPGEAVRREAVAVMREIGVDIERHRPKSVAQAMDPDVRLVIGLCAEEACPVIPGIPGLHWPIPNPAGQEMDFYREVRDGLAQRIRDLIKDLTGEAT